MLSIKLKKVLNFTYSSDAGGLIIGHTDVLSRTEEQRGQMEVSYLHSCRWSFSLARVSNLFVNENETSKRAGLIVEAGDWIPFKMITINEFHTKEGDGKWKFHRSNQLNICRRISETECLFHTSQGRVFNSYDNKTQRLLRSTLFQASESIYKRKTKWIR